ncbi:hypothetical protein, partial [Rhizobium sp. Root491]|uniref:hypothetical protein n=1 Tax=Rhizobium sp. Root491 TaxID=1736548 RepID=UPI001AECA960
LRRQQRRRPRSVSGLIRDHPQTSQHTKIQILKKTFKVLILKESFDFSGLHLPLASANGPIFNKGMPP